MIYRKKRRSACTTFTYVRCSYSCGISRILLSSSRDPCRDLWWSFTSVYRVRPTPISLVRNTRPIGRSSQVVRGIPSFFAFTPRCRALILFALKFRRKRCLVKPSTHWPLTLHEQSARTNSSCRLLVLRAVLVFPTFYMLSKWICM